MTAAVQPEAAAPPAHIAATARMMESRSMSSIPGSQLRIGGMEEFGQGWLKPCSLAANCPCNPSGGSREVSKGTLQPGTIMNIRAIAASAGLGLLAAACTQPSATPPAEPTPQPVADKPAAADDAFAYA